MVSDVAVRKRRVVNTSDVLHQEMLDIWTDLEKKHKKGTQRLLNRFERIVQKESNKSGCKGDELVAKVRDIFHNGLGIIWGEGEY